MGTVHDLFSKAVLNDGENLPTGPTDPWQTRIGQLLLTLSTPSQPREITVLTHLDAAVLLRNLLLCRAASCWDESACKRVWNEIVFSRLIPKGDGNEGYVRRQLERVRNSGFFIGSRASRQWVEEPLKAFDRNLSSVYAEQKLFLKEGHRSFLRACFVACLFGVNAYVVPDEAACRPPAPSIQPKDDKQNDPGRFRR